MDKDDEYFKNLIQKIDNCDEFTQEDVDYTIYIHSKLKKLKDFYNSFKDDGK